MLEDDLGASVVEFDGAVDFDDAAFEAAHVAHVFQVAGEDYHGERAGELLGAEVDEVSATCSGFYVSNFSDDAFGLADVLRGLVDGQAVGGKGGGRREEQKRCDIFFRRHKFFEVRPTGEDVN